MLNLDVGALLEIVLRTFIVYLVVVIGLRIFGKRELGQMTPFDLVLILTLSNAVQNAMTGPDTSLTGGIASALTLLTANWLFSRLRERVPWFSSWFVGGPILVMDKGMVLSDRLRRSGYTLDDLDEAAREHGVDSIKDVETAVVEVDGTISIIPMGAEGSVNTRRRRRRQHR